MVPGDDSSVRVKSELDKEKLPEKEALELAYKAISSGARGVDMGRNIFQSDNPVGMITAVKAIVHDGMKPDEAFELYRSEANK